MYCTEYGLRYIYLVFSVGTQACTMFNKIVVCSCFLVGRDECARQRFRIVGGGILMASVCVFIIVFVYVYMCVCVWGGVVWIYDPAHLLMHCHLCDTNVLVFVPNSVPWEVQSLELRNLSAMEGRTITLNNHTCPLNIRPLCFFSIRTLAVSVWELFMLKLVVCIAWLVIEFRTVS
jgi:hypothetical protein